MERARKDCEREVELRRTVERTKGDLQYDLKTVRIDVEHAQALLRQEIADVTARFTEVERNTKGLESSLSESRNEFQKAQVDK